MTTLFWDHAHWIGTAALVASSVLLLSPEPKRYRILILVLSGLGCLWLVLTFAVQLWLRS